MQKPSHNRAHGRPHAKKPVRARVEHSAGGIVFRRTPKGILVGFILDSYGKWTFPKGRVQAGEQVPAGAIRETREEMGIGRIWIIAPLGTATILFKDRFEQPGTMVKKYISYFLMETEPKEKGKAENKKTGETVSEIRWMPLERAVSFARYKNVKPIVKKAVALIGEITKQ